MVLKYERFREERGSTTGRLLFRGPRLKMGVTEGEPRTILPDHLGRADYYGNTINNVSVLRLRQGRLFWGTIRIMIRARARHRATCSIGSAPLASWQIVRMRAALPSLACHPPAGATLHGRHVTHTHVHTRARMPTCTPAHRHTPTHVRTNMHAFTQAHTRQHARMHIADKLHALSMLG